MRSLLLNSELLVRLIPLHGQIACGDVADALPELKSIIDQLQAECAAQEWWAKQSLKRKGYPRVIIEYDKGSRALILWNFAGEYVTTVYNHGQLLPLLAAESKRPGTIEAVVKGRVLKDTTRAELATALKNYLATDGKIKKLKRGKLDIEFSEIEDLL